MSATSTPPYSASASLARRAETPTRRRAGHELQQRPAAGRVERVEPAAMTAGSSAFAARSSVATTSPSRGQSSPGIRGGAGQISAVVSARSPTKSRTSRTARGRCGRARGRDERGLRIPEAERAGERRQAPAAVGIGDGAEIIQHQRQLDVALRGIEEAVEQLGEGLHPIRNHAGAGRQPRQLTRSITPSVRAARSKAKSNVASGSLRRLASSRYPAS